MLYRLQRLGRKGYPVYRLAVQEAHIVIHQVS